MSTSNEYEEEKMSIQPRSNLPLEAIAESCTCCSTPRPSVPMPIHGLQTDRHAPHPAPPPPPQTPAGHTLGTEK